MFHVKKIIPWQAFVVCAVLLIASGGYPANAADNQDIAISHYDFGTITVHGKSYTGDIVITADGTVSNWPDTLHDTNKPSDFDKIIPLGTTTLIIGIGAEQAASLPNKTFKYLREKGLNFHVLGTHEAVKLYNSLPKEGVVAVLHLTC